MVHHQPEGYHTVNSYLITDNAAKAIEYYKKVFGATERMRMQGPDGKIGHVELIIGDSVVMLADQCPESKTPGQLGGSPVGLMLYVKDVDATMKMATAEGGKVVRPVETQFYGDRSGTLIDPFGHIWYVATHVEDVTPEEMEKRAKESMKEKEHAKAK
jgi:PhnB protein